MKKEVVEQETAAQLVQRYGLREFLEDRHDAYIQVMRCKREIGRAHV